MKKHVLTNLVPLICTAIFALPVSAAEIGVSSNSIKIGSTKNLSLPVDSRPLAISEGSKLFFAQLNRSGGIFGRKIDFVEYDDAYDPKRSVANIKRPISDDKVFLIFGTYGTANINAMAPVIAASHVPGFAIGGSLGSITKDDLVNLFSVKGTFSDEAKEMSRFLFSKSPHPKLALFYQDDALGNEGRGATIKALHEKNLKPTVVKAFGREAVEIDENWLPDLKADGTEMISIFSNERAGIKLLAALTKKDIHIPVIVISALAGSDFFQKASSFGSPVYVVHGYPSIKQMNLPIVADYLAASKAAGKVATDPGLCGYIDASVLAEALKLAGKDLTRETFLRTVREEMKSVDIKGIKISFGPDQHTGLRHMMVSAVKGAELAAP